MRLLTSISWLVLVLSLGLAFFVHLDEIARATALEVVEEHCR